ncbi:HAMP domain-containing sensor histidine kinase [Neobacillus sp. OS1-2]|uniref:sensor histidine kinase n=1 Tax=Neobacillus sp. OS1-2 TaxID=3070680 RepID=UPI0027E0F237|nr:HAMP domain-containing sensor histidine kinase [Neobacillus sp. OS1-2]WML38231.1 HAMP domain-containing sensor histidine kinase [Neobacillus sp. OS1-2]
MKGSLVRHLFGIFIFLTMMIVSFSIAYLVKTIFYQKFHLHLSHYIQYLGTTILGFFIFVCIGYSFGKIIRSRQRNHFKEIIDALRKIAKGDFNIQLQTLKREDPFTTLIDHINHMAKQLKEMEAMRQEFISNVSHEIQSPLTSIGGFAKALQYDELTNEERSHYLSIIETETYRLSKLSDNLLKLTSLESEHHPFERKNYRLDQQIRNIILACEPNWMEKEIEIDVSLEKVHILADEDLMSQVWTNLIHNSIKFTPNLGKIRVRLKNIDGKAMIKISDTGIGISKKDQVHIFERFFKADKARERSRGGSGLGLSIVKKIIEMHDGAIYVESEIEKGTTFTIFIPV